MIAASGRFPSLEPSRSPRHGLPCLDPHLHAGNMASTRGGIPAVLKS